MSSTFDVAKRGGWFYPTVVMLVVQAMTSVCIMSPAVLAPVAAADFGLPATWIGAFTSIAYLAAMISGTTSSAWIQRVGSVQLAALCMLIAGIGLATFSFGTALAGTVAALLIGVCYGHINPISAYVLNLVSPPRWRPLIFSVKQTGVVFGGAIAGAVVPVLIISFGWKTATVTVAFFAIVTIAAVWPLRKRFPAERNATPEPSFRVGARSLGLILSQRKLCLGAFGAAGFSGVQVSIAAFTVLFLSRDLDMPLITAGLIFSVSQIAGIIGRLFWGYVSGGWMNATMTLVTIGALSALSISALFFQETGASELTLSIICFSLGFTSFGWNGVFIADVTNSVTQPQVGAAVGGTQFFFFGGVVVVPALVALVVERAGFKPAFVLMCAVALAASLCHWRSGSLTITPRTQD